MAFNTVKRPKDENQDKGKSLFSYIEKAFNLNNIFNDGLPVKYLPRILWLAMLALIYIANAHYGEKTVRQIEETKTQVEDLRADYTTLKADYMYASKQSEVAKKVEELGLYESSEPPYKIIVKEED